MMDLLSLSALCNKKCTINATTKMKCIGDQERFARAVSSLDMRPISHLVATLLLRYSAERQPVVSASQ